jgi:uncharacterized protein (TIGR02996 family)
MTREAFLRAVVEQPDDDVLRLVYADWLDDQGDAERAEFIRLQVELARLPEGDAARAAKERREDELLLACGEAWLAPLQDILSDVDCTPVFHRGFVAEVTFWGQSGARRLVEQADALFGVAPVRWVRLLPVAGHAGRSFPWDRRPKLDVDRLSLADLQAVVAVPVLARVVLLDLGSVTLADPEDGPDIVVSNLINDNGARHLAGSPHLAGLKTLLLPDNVIGDPGAFALVESPHLAGLATLDLSRNWIGEAARTELRRRVGERLVLD